MGNPDVVIREAELPSDAAELAEVYLSSARHHAALAPESYRVPDVRDVVARYERSQRDEAVSAIFVAAFGGRIVGVAEARLVPPPEPAVMLRSIPTASIEVAVLDAHRGKGVGERLMDASHEWAFNRGVRRFLVDALAVNRRAVEFYKERMGYELFGVILVRTTPVKSPGR
jgi:GNAT superfamily N-acetyltransferase